MARKTNTERARRLIEKRDITTDADKRKDITNKISEILLADVNNDPWVQKTQRDKQDFQTLANQAKEALIKKLT
jgi:hypothetical protein